MKKFYVDCYICGNHYDANESDVCKVCGWMFSGCEYGLGEDEIDTCNTMSRREAKKNFQNTGSIWGKSIPLTK